jgi:glycosyltransferase involved in cell wall biosynthesis
MFSWYPITVVNDYSAALRAQIAEALCKDHFDLIVCDFLQPSLNLWSVRECPVLLFQHNVESMIVKRHFIMARNPFLKLFWWMQWRKMERYERQACQRFSGIVTVSETDKQILEKDFGAQQVFAIPTGVDTQYFYPRQDAVDPDSLIFTGSMDWLPNEDAILFFAREIWGKIKEKVPGSVLTVVGRNPSRHLRQELRPYADIRLVGWVKDVRPFIARHALYIIPLRIGGGTRIKAYEAMAMGKAVVSTTIGMEGLPVKNGEHVILADSPQGFADAVVRLLQNPGDRRRIGVRARDYVEKNFGWERAAQTFAEACHRIVALKEIG